MKREAIAAAWWTPLKNGQAACTLCPIGCRLRPGQAGPCGTRANEEGTMVPLHYGQLASLGVDPIEKKPLYHYYPGRNILSAAAPGCNLHCLFCQNYSLSQGDGQRTQAADADQLIAAAQRENSVGLAYTYSEPLVWYEFVRDMGQAMHQVGMKNILITNGFLNPDPLAEILPLIDAANIDLKSMDDRFYRKVCKARLEPVLAAIEQFLEAGVHVELTNLVIPGENDSDEQLNRLITYVADLEKQYGANIPLHFSAYHPAWKMTNPPTSRETLLRARELAVQKLRWVYLGNIREAAGRDTCCPGCGKVLIARAGYEAEVELTEDAQCPACGTGVPVIMNVS